MEFEYDHRKSELNAERHGIDFAEAQALWDDPWLVEFDIDYGGESRWGAIAFYAGAKWTAVCTTRGERVRIISVRRSTPKEGSFYDRENDGR